jgi:hypothetical protein
MRVDIIVGIGAAIAYASGTFWKKYRLLHLAPWLYGFVIYFLTFYPKAGFKITPPIVMGFVLYVMAWASTLDKARSNSSEA